MNHISQVIGEATCNTSALGAEVRGSQVLGQTGLCSQYSTSKYEKGEL